MSNEENNDLKVKEKKGDSGFSELLQIFFMLVFLALFSVFLLKMLGNDVKEERELIANIEKTQEKKILDVVKIDEITVRDSSSVSYITLSGNKLKRELVIAKEKNCVFGKLDVSKSYAVYGYSYEYKGMPIYHIENPCEDLKPID